MDGYFSHIESDQPAQYIVKVQGRVERDLSSWFITQPTCAYEMGALVEGLPADVITVISGMIADQAGLYGLLSYMRDLGFSLLLVDCLTARQDSRE
jgi:hypothetical protein